MANTRTVAIKGARSITNRPLGGGVSDSMITGVRAHGTAVLGSISCSAVNSGILPKRLRSLV